MRRDPFHKLKIGFVLCSFLLAACSAIFPELEQKNPGTFPVDAQLREFYTKSGGEELYGPAIAEVTVQDYLRCQLMANARLCVNTNLRGAGKFFLSPLGRQLGIPWNTDVPPSAIFPDFNIKRQQLGEDFTGQPIGVVQFNYLAGRVEQYFEKVGFYHGFDEPAGAAHLLPYGDAVCGNACAYQPPVQFNPISADFWSPMRDALDAFGGNSFSGQALTPMFLASDGNQEQVFANVVVFAPVENPGAIAFRQMPVMLENLASEMVKQTLGEKENMTFLALQEDLGHHIPLPFQAYINSHGGEAVFGLPISEMNYITEKKVYQQCFETLCLQYFPQAADAYKVLPAPLGQDYLLKFRPVVPGGQLRAEDVLLTTDVSLERIKNTENQVIRLTLLQKYSSQAIPGITPVIFVRDDIGNVVFEGFMPKTDAEGQATITLAPAAGGSNGDLFLYQVCITENTNSPICSNGSYLIWNQ